MVGISEWIDQSLAQARRLWLFLDYDGTLADFAPTPEHVSPDPEIIGLLDGLVQYPHIRVAVISGRRLAHVEALVPVPGILLAGTYGVELRTPEGERINRVEKGTIRLVLNALMPRWLQLIAGREGFALEDKYWALALHARFADNDEAEEVLATARRMAAGATVGGSPGRLCLLDGHKFLEIGPQLAHKGRTVGYLLGRYPWPRALPLYLGDDDKDEEAFGVIKARGGIAILVSPEPRKTKADFRLASPQAARHWLATLPTRFGEQEPLVGV